MKMYNHYDHQDSLFSLHDCHVKRILFEDGTLSFYFPDGFWVLDKHPQNKFGKTVKSDASKVDYLVLDKELDNLYFAVFSKTGFAKAVREEWEPGAFMNAVNAGAFHVEIITPFKAFQSLLLKCWIWFEQKPYHKECEILIDTDKATYCWDKLCEDREW